MATDERPEAAHGERVAVGRINAAWGLKGFVKVTPFTSNPTRLAAGSVVLVLGAPTEILEVVTPQGYPIVRFAGYEGRAAVEPLLGTTIEIEASDLPALPEDEWYVDDLVGLDVVTASGDRIGELSEVLRTGSNDVYVVRRDSGRDVLVPAIQGVLVQVDLEARRVVVEAVPGLLE